MFRSLLLASSLAFASVTPSAVGAPRPDDGLEARLLELTRGHAKLARLNEHVGSRRSPKSWHLELGRGDAEQRASRPALLVVAGLEGRDSVATESLLTWAARLLERHADAPELLDTTTIHVLPRINPEAVNRGRARPVQELRRSAKPVDDDHDGLIDEDGPDDLNGDGLISWMRIEDPEGRHLIDPEEPRLMIEADAARGEIGGWRYLIEGRDDDSDEKWNEDPVGGVNFNRNFPHGYEWFATDSGVHQVSEIETRALADFVVAHPNIGLVMSYGAADNLGEASKGAETKSGGEGERGGRFRRPKPPTRIAGEDVPYLNELGKRHRAALGLEKGGENVTVPGSFSDWVYYHRGRLSLATRSWTPAMQRGIDAKADADADADAAGEQPEDDSGTAEASSESATPEAEAAKAVEETGRKRGGGRKKGGGDEARNLAERDHLKWLEEHHPAGFLAWEAVEHPDFPGQRAEVGGFAPFAWSEPPAEMLADLASRHADFLDELAASLPRVAFRRVKVEHAGRGVFEITAEIENRGYMPTVLEHGVVTREVHPTRVVLDLPEAAFLAGARETSLAPLAGSGGMEEVRWVVHASGSRFADLHVVSALGGSARTRVEFNSSSRGGRR